MLELVPDVYVTACATGQQGQIDVVARPEKEISAVIACVHESSDATCAAALVTAARCTRTLCQTLGKLHALHGRRRCREMAGELEQRFVQVDSLVEPVLPWAMARKQQLARFLLHFVARHVNRLNHFVFVRTHREGRRLMVFVTSVRSVSALCLAVLALHRWCLVVLCYRLLVGRLV